MIRILISGLLFLFFSACSWRQNTKTPEEFLYVDTTTKGFYNESRSNLADSIRYFILHNKEPYHSKEYNFESILEIDTVVFGPDKNKLFFIAITKNSNDKLLSGGNKDEFHHDAYSFIARANESGNWIIKWLDAYNFISYPSHQEASASSRRAHFEMFTERRDVDGKSLFKYNVNDKRFWDGPIWEIYY